MENIGKIQEQALTATDVAGNRLRQEAAESRSYLELFVDKTAGRIWDNDAVDRHVADGLKTAGLFLRGRTGLYGTALLYAADQAKPSDPILSQLADAGLGGAKGGLLKGVFHAVGQKDLPIAAKGVSLGVSSRVLDLGLTRATYVEAQSGQVSLAKGLNTIAQQGFSRQALVMDVAVFGSAHTMMAGINSVTLGGLKSSPFWATSLTGTTFGIASGGSGELLRQHNAGESLDISKVVKQGLVRGAIDTVAAMPGGMQARAHLSHQFKDSFGIFVHSEKGLYKYTLQAEGQTKTLFATDASLRGLREGRGRLAEISGNVQSDLAQRFGVSFSPEGELVKDSMRTRQPRLDELSGISAALEHSWPSNLSKDGTQGAKFYFLQEQASRGSTNAFFELDANQKPSVYMAASARLNQRATEKDPDRDAEYYEHKRDSIEATVTHELGHNGQLKMDWYGQVKSVAETFGWQTMTDTAGNTTYMIKAKDGSLYRETGSRSWIRVNPEGQPLDFQGRPTERNGAMELSDSEMRGLAQVTPASRYFPNPGEMLVEGLKCIRLNAERRATLLKESPEVYRLAKEWDQSEINHHYGVEVDGQPKIIRLPDGTLANNTESARKLVTDLEK